MGLKFLLLPCLLTAPEYSEAMAAPIKRQKAGGISRQPYAKSAFALMPYLLELSGAARFFQLLDELFCFTLGDTFLDS